MNVIVCYVLGENFYIYVMEGFFTRVWGEFGIDRVVMFLKGIFIVRFNNTESRFKMLGSFYV